jgi:hypothetical protein
MELAVEERFKFLNREAELDLTIHAYGLSTSRNLTEKVLVTGANGFVGSHLIHELGTDRHKNILSCQVSDWRMARKNYNS